MKRNLATILLLATLCAHAEVLVYKSKETVTTTGRGGTTKSKFGGYTVIEEDGRVADIITYARNGVDYFTVHYPDPAKFSVDSILGGAKNYTVFSTSESYFDENENQNIRTAIAKGANAAVIINGKTWNVPKVFTTTGKAIYPTASGQMVLEEWTGTMTLNKNDSDFFNFARFDFEKAIDQIKAWLGGYTEE